MVAKEKKILARTLLVIWSFWKPFKKILETILVSRLYEQSQNLPEVGGDSLPPGKVTPPPSTLMYSFHFYVMIKGIVKSLVIWSFWMAFKRIQETISNISHPYEYIGCVEA